jgi:2-polyprenyl-3-methyl-5-hydroxy-6-metoxy-1,4-benzoquinol methylase
VALGWWTNMNMNKISSRYKKDIENNIWKKNDYQGIPYNDGDDIENKIKSILQNCKNVDVHSSELKNHCIDWPQTYHLSPERSNIIRPFSQEFNGKDVLEIGGGCGAISRYLGECGATLVTLEGSIRRASIARERTRDLKNVTIIADSFEGFSTDYKFDIVTLIGVLEYANVFSNCSNPINYMLKKAKSFLKPNGKLIVAIENRLGLKYFAGASEDHIGTPMYGIEGRYKTDEVITFGKIELKERFLDSGFKSIDFYAPFPDYKFPSFILSEKSLNMKGFDSKIFPILSSCRDPLLPRITNFNIERVWEYIDKNKLTLDLSNSFLCVGKVGELEDYSNPPIAYSYSTNRHKMFCKERLFLTRDNGDIYTTVNFPYFDTNLKDQSSLVELNIEEDSGYKYGKLLILDMVSIITSVEWKREDLLSFFEIYLDILRSESGVSDDELTIDTLMPNFLLDAIPQNIIILDDGSHFLIDKEWQYTKKLELGYLIFRTSISIVNIITKMGIPKDKSIATLRDFIFYLFDVISFPLSEEKYQEYIKNEKELRFSITGCDIFNFNDDVILVTKNSSDIVSEFNFNQQFNISNIEKHKLEIEKHKLEIENLRCNIQMIKNSLSWRITQPLRKINSIFLKVK